MPPRDEALLKRLLATFRVEADEHVHAIADGLRALAATSGSGQAAVIESIYRETHSLKGAARAVNLGAIEALCHPMESVFAALKQGRLAASPELVTLMQECVDTLQPLAAAGPDSTATIATAPLIQRLQETLRALDRGQGVRPVALPPAGASAPTLRTAPVTRAPDVGSVQTVRVAASNLDAVMRQAEELLTPRLAAAQRWRDAREAAARVAAWRRRRANLRPLLRQIGVGGASAVNAWPSVLEYLDSEQVALDDLEQRLTRLTRAARRDQRQLVAMTDAMHRDVRDMQLLPFASLLESFPRFVRELAREQGKEVDLVIEGGDLKIDRRILEEMKAPLIHLLRNSVDHGIEPPDERRHCGKPRQGTIRLAITAQQSGRAELTVADDGAGIDMDKVRASARALGLVNDGASASSSGAAALSLVFLSGVSTSSLITDVSGRGLGLSIVREKVERLGGGVAVDTRAGSGTTFHIELPLSVAVFRGVIVRAGAHGYVLPGGSVERIVRVAPDEVRTVENRPTVALGDRTVAMASLADVLEVAPTPAAADGASLTLVVIGSDSGRVALRVDELLGEQEVLMKGLGPQLARVRNVAGACLLGTGHIVPVLSVPDLLKSAARTVTTGPRPAPPRAAPGPARSILIAEDSITSRSLLKSILEAAGYRVTTAVDGIDAYTTLKSGAFDLVVSDVEMPRLDGFDLTARIRADRALADLPVVLVTALATSEHRERGIDAGANAYIVKSTFDQSNLLEVVQRLIGRGVPMAAA